MAGSRLSGGVRRRFQFHLAVEELPLLEREVDDHGSVQSAIVAALRAQADRRLQRAAEAEPRADLTDRTTAEAPLDVPEPRRSAGAVSPAPAAAMATVELLASDGARVLDVSADVVRGRVRRGELAGRRDEAGRWRVELDRGRVLGSGVDLDTRGAAVVAGVKPRTVGRRCAAGGYPNAYESSTGWRVPVSDLLQ